MSNSTNTYSRLLVCIIWCENMLVYVRTSLLLRTTVLKYLTCYYFALGWLFTCGVCGALVLGSIPSLVICTQTLLCVQVHGFLALELVHGKGQAPVWFVGAWVVCLLKISMSSFFQGCWRVNSWCILAFCRANCRWSVLDFLGAFGLFLSVFKFRSGIIHHLVKCWKNSCFNLIH